ncbi:MAG: OmpA family protein [Spirochaetaceae bacterium]|nr:OmpA family protein [Spirochaetaceae bacterium]
MARTKKKEQKAGTGWLMTFTDMVTLLLVFFVLMLGDPVTDNNRMQLVLASFSGLGPLTGGMTLSPGRLAQMGASVEAFPSNQRAASLDQAIERAISAIRTETQNMLQVEHIPERGIVITLTGDAFFRPGSPDVDIERTRTILDNLAHLFNSAELFGRTFRIEGHTDSQETSPFFRSGWELSAARANNILHYLVDFGAPQRQFQVVAYSNMRPARGFEANTPENRAMNRRVEIVILTDGQL